MYGEIGLARLLNKNGFKNYKAHMIITLWKMSYLNTFIWIMPLTFNSLNYAFIPMVNHLKYLRWPFVLSCRHNTIRLRANTTWHNKKNYILKNNLYYKFTMVHITQHDMIKHDKKSVKSPINLLYIKSYLKSKLSSLTSWHKHHTKLLCLYHIGTITTLTQ